MLKLVGFDLDDTLIDDVSATREGVRRLASAWGALDLERLVDAWQEASAFHFQQYVNGTESLELNRIRRVQDVSRAYGKSLDEEAAAEYFLVYRAGYEAGWQCFRDTLSVVVRLRTQGLTLGIITNGDGPTQRAKIRAVGLQDLIPIIVISGEFGRAKPDPAIFHHLLDQAQCPPERAVFIGDRLDKDVDPARALGMHAIHCDRTQGDSLEDVYQRMRQWDTRL